MGPPRVTPAMCWLYFPFGRPARLLSQLLELNDSSRKKSYALPRKEFEPCLIEALMTAPAALPNSAEYVRVCTRNSSSASTGGWMTCGLRSWRLVEKELLSAPSSMKLFQVPGFPLTLKKVSSPR